MQTWPRTEQSQLGQLGICGVGIGCHGGLRIVGDTSRMAMPECGIGLVPDVGGTALLANAPGRLGAYLALTAARMGPGDAIHAGFADRYLPEAAWPDLVALLEDTGDPSVIPQETPPASEMADQADDIDRLFAAPDLPTIAATLAAEDGPLAESALKAVRRNSPIAMAATLGILDRLGPNPSVREALVQEYRYTWRAMQDADFLEGVRAQIIDKDRNPSWADKLTTLDPTRVEAILAPLGASELTFDDKEDTP